MQRNRDSVLGRKSGAVGDLTPKICLLSNRETEKNLGIVDVSFYLLGRARVQGKQNGIATDVLITVTPTPPTRGRTKGTRQEKRKKAEWRSGRVGVGPKIPSFAISANADGGFVGSWASEQGNLETEISEVVEGTLCCRRIVVLMMARGVEQWLGQAGLVSPLALQLASVSVSRDGSSRYPAVFEARARDFPEKERVDARDEDRSGAHCNSELGWVVDQELRPFAGATFHLPRVEGEETLRTVSWMYLVKRIPGGSGSGRSRSRSRSRSRTCNELIAVMTMRFLGQESTSTLETKLKFGVTRKLRIASEHRCTYKEDAVWAGFGKHTGVESNWILDTYLTERMSLGAAEEEVEVKSSGKGRGGGRDGDRRGEVPTGVVGVDSGLVMGWLVGRFSWLVDQGPRGMKVVLLVRRDGGGEGGVGFGMGWNFSTRPKRDTEPERTCRTRQDRTGQDRTGSDQREERVPGRQARRPAVPKFLLRPGGFGGTLEAAQQELKPISMYVSMHTALAPMGPRAQGRAGNGAGEAGWPGDLGAGVRWKGGGREVEGRSRAMAMAMATAMAMASSGTACYRYRLKVKEEEEEELIAGTDIRGQLARVQGEDRATGKTIGIGTIQAIQAESIQADWAGQA
ncbi:hypothetical protein MBM_01087 [Drepanopeziza brunnea f. sp. 'multigermtubi' MB_m1]|uniref:Uncharacterized protein n=1 Tax=Marssonina brunnea f. sp. multigermtubi (strain MB_m1) TaxID=1072389 RepID=K1WRX9_MARBU|nr:uncharacterized protein MBM_01087 [Drepanopeziza brunnea f. sp. 'multigermtubi' MB_m1]EKD20405.1 hypothetical protein MBM_01087 [Drepanopeziza brunnea f. sp. 'multigermtubi' MB_m1]